MEKLVFYKVWYFEDFKKCEKYYFETEYEAQVARFSAYSGYDYERLTKRNFFVPVSFVKPVLIPEAEIDKITIYHVKETQDEVADRNV